MDLEAVRRTATNPASDKRHKATNSKKRQTQNIVWQAS